jgi:organic hydroperoxide reductase OsmC/OhrA
MTATAAPAYLGNPANVDPEEAFVASLSSCHMLTFLAIACKQKFVVDSYEDEAVGHVEKMPKAKWPSLASSFARRLAGVEIEHQVQNSSTKCTMPHTRIVSLPTRSKPT